jgi:Acetyltransferase (GNAT) domain
MGVILDTTAVQPHQTDDQPYSSADFRACWWHYLAPKFKLKQAQEQLVVWQKPYLKGFVHLNELRQAGWNCSLNQDFTVTEAQTLLNLPTSMSWDVFKVMWSTLRPHKQAFQTVTDAGYSALQKPALTQYEVDLSLGWEPYLASKSYKTRKKIRTLLKQADTMGAYLQPFDDPNAIEPFYDRFFKHHIEYWGQKAGGSYFTCPHERAFIQAWSLARAQQGQLVLDGLYMADQLVQMNMAILTPSTYYGLLTINTGTQLDYHPGLVGMYMRIQQQMAARQVPWFNLGAHDAEFKRQASTHIIPCNEWIVANPRSLRGRWLLSRQTG